MSIDITLDLYSGWTLICVTALLSATAFIMWYRKKGHTSERLNNLKESVRTNRWLS